MRLKLILTLLLAATVARADSKWTAYPQVTTVTPATLFSLTLPGVTSETVAASNLLSALAGAVTNDGVMYVEATGTQPGNGTSWAPYRCPTAASFSALFANETRTNVVWHLGRGTFLKNSDDIVPLAGWKIRGSGVGVTVVKMKDSAASGMTNSVFASWVRTDGVEISGMTIDNNLQHQTSPAKGEAIRLIGSEITIENIKAINWGGISNECFVIAVGNGQNEGDNNTNYSVRIKNCDVTQPANINLTSNGVTAISIHADGPITGLAAGASITGCSVYNVRSAMGGLGSPSYFHAYSDGTGGAVENCYAYNLNGNGSVGCYNDSWDGHSAVIKNCVFDNVHICVMENKPTTSITDMAIVGNVFRPDADGIGVYYNRDDGSDPTAFAKQLALLGNVIVPAFGSGGAMTPVSIDTGAYPVTMVGNVLQPKGGQAAIYIIGQSNLVANANYTNSIP